MNGVEATDEPCIHISQPFQSKQRVIVLHHRNANQRQGKEESRPLQLGRRKVLHQDFGN